MERTAHPVWQQCLRTIEPVLESLGFRLTNEAQHHAHFGSASAEYERAGMRIELFWDGKENWIDAHYFESDRNDRHVERTVEEPDAGLVLGRRARRAAGALGEDDDLPILGEFLSRPGNERPERRGALPAVDVDHAAGHGVEAEERDPLQLPFHHVGRERQELHQRQRLEGGLVLRGDDGGPRKQETLSPGRAVLL